MNLHISTTPHVNAEVTAHARAVIASLYVSLEAIKVRANKLRKTNTLQHNRINFNRNIDQSGSGKVTSREKKTSPLLLR